MMAVGLTGLGADSPAAALALYGAVRLLGSRAEARWVADQDASSWHAEIRVEGCDDVDALADRLHEAIRANPLTEITSLAKDINEVDRGIWITAIEEGGARSAVVSGLCAESPLRRNSDRLALTPLCVYSFGTRGTLFGNVAKQDRELEPKDLRAVLAGPWIPKKGVNTLGLDPLARRQDGAIIGPDPSADGVRGIPGLVPLMIRGLAVVAPMPGHDVGRGGAFVRADREVSFSWPVFTAWCEERHLALLAGRDWVARSRAQRAAASIEAVFASQIVRTERRLSIGRRLS